MDKKYSKEYYENHRIRIQSSINKRKANIERMIAENMNNIDEESLFKGDY